MYQIALCDDEKTELDKTQAILADYKKMHPEFEITAECFLDASQLLERVQKHGYMRSEERRVGKEC